MSNDFIVAKQDYQCLNAIGKWLEWISNDFIIAKQDFHCLDAIRE